jgi:putative transposase
LNSALRKEVHTQQGKEPEPSAAILDRQSAKPAEGGEERGYGAGKKVTGRKRHIFVDTLGLVLLVLVTAGNVQDRDGARIMSDCWKPARFLSM